MRRVWPLQLLLALVAVVAAGLVWLTHHPGSPVLERATSWPVVGSLAEEIRRIYLPPEEEPGAPSPSSRKPILDEPSLGKVPPSLPASPEPRVEIDPFDRPAFEARPFEWFRAGTAIYQAPSLDAPIVSRLDRVARLGFLERRGDWARTRIGSKEAWILVTEDTVSRDPPLGREPSPVLPVTGRPPDPQRLAEARSLLRPPWAEERLGPYELSTDIRDRALLAYLEKVAAQHEEAYRRRYGLPATGEPAAAVVLFARPDDYRRFQQAERGLEGLRAAGHAGSGIVALAAGESSRELVAAVLVHELTHLLNRRSIGPALPPWLEEGLAEDLGGSRLDPEGRVLPGTVQETTTFAGSRIEIRGFGASLKGLREASRKGRLVPLRDLLEMDWQAFVSKGRLTLHYAESGMFIRFLLAPETGYGKKFRAFLRAVSRGGPATSEALLASLETSWKDLDGRFRAWLSYRLEHENRWEQVKKSGDPPG